jgi:hypothetical protein
MKLQMFEIIWDTAKEEADIRYKVDYREAHDTLQLDCLQDAVGILTEKYNDKLKEAYK